MPAAKPRIPLRRVEAGLYETRDGQYGVVRVESVTDEWGSLDQGGWAIVRGSAKHGEEIPGEYRTKADAHDALTALLAG